ncbi:hypothetical protein PBRA_003761 [Plasmodiophora brassicae]|nr:hypothetical protein PBRA_003761 [Plasmodiophora brassicae]
MPKVKDALGYLEKVKKKFYDRPNVYNQFLEIMKEFKAQTINTEGVIKRVTTLFQGHRELILGFNQFLPPGYKITDPTVPPPEPPQQKPTVEFNHAVKYVAKIKQRFESRPEVYEEFLEILHAYQEKRTTETAIEQVKAKVQNLFRGHPDLLDDFNYFLPPEASGALPAGVAKQQKKKRPRKEEPGGTSSVPPLGVRRMDSGPIGVPPPPPVRAGTSPIASSTMSAPGLPTANRRISGNIGGMIPPGPYATVSYPPDSKKEMQLFEKIKMIVPRSLYVQLMRVLNLFSCNIITRAELMSLVDDLFLKNPKFAEFAIKFKEVLGYNEWEENQLMTHMRSNFYAFVSSVDFTTCTQVTPSYRLLPAEIPCPPCSGRSILGDSVLNDTCISIPTGTEDQSFKSSRKNQYEEALFKVEDERYEIDMMIENNAAAIRVLQPLCDKIEVLTLEQASAFKLDNSVDILHIRAMARIYGDAWYDIIRLLRLNPSTAIPVILKRLKQKDVEWRRARENMKKTWQDVVKANYHRSLDHRSFTFKSEEKKRLSSKFLIAELKDLCEKMAEGAEEKGVFTNASLQPSLYNYCMNFSLDDQAVHPELLDLIERCINHLPDEDRSQLLSFWNGFVLHFLNATDKSDLLDGPDASTRPVRLSMSAWALEETINPMRRHTRESNLFFGNLSFYVFFRLHQFLYSRWKTCRDLALAKPDGESVYQQFKELVYKLLDNQVDQVTYEDNLRALVGAKSYPMFTIDKLVAAIVKQMQTVAGSALSQKLISLYGYEHSRALDKSVAAGDDPLERSALLARMYLMNCSSLLNEDDHCIQIEFFKDSNEMGIAFLENVGSAEAKPSSAAWEQYLDRYLSTRSDLLSSGTNPFLRRNLRRAQQRRPSPDPTVTINALESKICRRTFKTYYIEDTEDMFYRRRPTTRRIRYGRLKARFAAWWEKQPAFLDKPDEIPAMFRAPAPMEVSELDMAASGAPSPPPEPTGAERDALLLPLSSSSPRSPDPDVATHLAQPMDLS